MGSHTVTSHSSQMNVICLNPISQAGRPMLDLPIPQKVKAELTFFDCLYTAINGLPVHGRPDSNQLTATRPGVKLRSSGRISTLTIRSRSQFYLYIYKGLIQRAEMMYFVSKQRSVPGGLGRWKPAYVQSGVVRL